ncbi:MAG: hypothetical protein WC350_00550 [Candidatus Micrarchaeia archaeon]|jgi:hypothetical protein
MEVKGKPALGPETRVRRLANLAARYAAEGRKRDSEIAFKKAFEAVRGMEFGTPKNAVYERSELASGLAEEVVEAGLSASFAMQMWTLGCNAKALGDEAGGVTLVYPLDIMEMAAKEEKAVEDEGVPPVVCEVEEKKVKKEKRARALDELFDEMVSAVRQFSLVKLFLGEEGEQGKAGKD